MIKGAIRQTGKTAGKSRFRRIARALEPAFSFLGRRGGRVGSCRRGATAVEFALVAPLFLAMTLGVVEVGRAMWIKATMQYAVEETARHYMVTNGATTATLQTYAQDTLEGIGMSSTGMTFLATQTTEGGIDYMSITVTYNFVTLIQIVKLPDMTLNAKSKVPANS